MFRPIIKTSIKAIRLLSAALLTILYSSCDQQSKPIEYGVDKCEFCRMSIVDQRFGCEIVTQKGKIYMFDAVECMVNYLDENVEDESKLKLMLTNTYDAPGKLTDVKMCTYLQSEQMPSPMGMYLNPFRDSGLASKSQEENTGKLMDWTELRAHFMAYR
jgi:copper chaperone NosL